MVVAKKLRHFALAVKDAEATAAVFQKALGATVIDRTTMEKEKQYRVSVSVAGVRINLLQPNGPESAVAKDIARRGEGLHCICFDVEDLQEAARELKDAGLRVAVKEGRSYVFIHPQDTAGVMFELHSSE